MQYYQFAAPDCEFVTMQEDPGPCPLCGNEEYIPVEETEITPRGWQFLFREADRDHNPELAYKFCVRGAGMGDPVCLCEQGRRLYLGEGTRCDPDQAANCFEEAAAKGSALGQCQLGVCFEKGKGRPQSWENAAFLYRQAADQGLPSAQCNLGWCYEYGKGAQ